MMGGITVSYSGVHQAYQLALAADEAGNLDKFYCSFYDAPGFWADRIGKVAGANRFASRFAAGLSESKIEEYPWPLLLHEALALFRSKVTNDWLIANDWFDRHVARALRRSQSRLFVGVETCACRSFEVARELKIQTLLDCPGIDATYLDARAGEAAREFGLEIAVQSDSIGMQRRKAREFRLADRIIVCSGFQLKTMGLAPEKVSVVPLWIDQQLWHSVARRRPDKGAVRALFAGKISVRKGVPYLLRAVEALSGKVCLTLVGSLDADVAPMLKSTSASVKVLPARPKSQLPQIYGEHDLFVLPSLGDAFGIAALEAMACGLPVIVTDHCGVPVPAPEWRVPAMEIKPLKDRLLSYYDDRDLLASDGRLAQEFANHYTPEQYRSAICSVFRSVESLND